MKINIDMIINKYILVGSISIIVYMYQSVTCTYKNSCVDKNICLAKACIHCLKFTRVYLLITCIKIENRKLRHKSNITRIVQILISKKFINFWKN